MITPTIPPFSFPRVVLPAPALRKIVRFYDWVEISPEQGPLYARLYPNFSTGLIFFFSGQAKVAELPLLNKSISLSSANLFPPISTVVENNRWVGLKMLRVVLCEGAIHMLFAIPASAFLNTSIDLRYDLDEKIVEIYDRLLESPSLEAKIAVIEGYLLKLLFHRNCSEENLLKKVKECLRENANYKVKVVAQQLGLSRQHFNRLAQRDLGFSAKNTLEILRFNDVLRYINTTPSFDLLDITHEFSYYDQAHFTHKFKSISGISPGEFIRTTRDRYYYEGPNPDFSATEVVK